MVSGKFTYHKKRARIVILALVILTLAVVIALVFEFLPKHLSAFLELALTCRTAFTLVISPFFAGGFPAFQSLCHKTYRKFIFLS
jgi:hypothetical protein